MNQIEVMRQALEALEILHPLTCHNIITDLRLAIEQAERVKRAEKAFAAASEEMKGEQEPVAWELRKGKTDRVLLEITNNPRRAHDWKCSLEEVVPLYTAPPQRQPLTDEEIWYLASQAVIGGDVHVDKLVRSIEAAHGIGAIGGSHD